MSCYRGIKAVWRYYNSCTSKFPVVNRWWSLLAGVFMELGGGNQYSFSVYSSDLRFLMGFKIRDVDLMGTTMNIFVYFGIFISLFYDIFGPRPACILCGILSFSGYFLIYVAMKRWVMEQTPAWLFCVFFAMCGSGGFGMYSAGLATNIKNFDQRHRGKVVGFLVCFFGLSAGFLGVVYKYILERNCFNYILFLSIFLAVIPFLSFWVLNIVPKEETETLKEKEIISYEESYNSINSDEDVIINDEEKENKVTSESKENELESKKFEKIGSSISTCCSYCCKREYPLANQDVPPWRVLLYLEFYCILFVNFAGVGSGLIMMNAIHEIVISYSPPTESMDVMNSITGSLVIIISVFNTLGRLFFGFASDLTSSFFSRTGWYCVTITIMTISQMCFAFSSVNGLYFCCMICGFSYGGIFLCSPSICSELWGMKYFAMNLTLCQLGCAMGSFILATALQSTVYERMQNYNDYNDIGFSDQNNEDALKCFGSKCFRPTFFITTILCLIGIIAGLILHSKTRELYDEIYLLSKKDKSKKKKCCVCCC